LKIEFALIVWRKEFSPEFLDLLFKFTPETFGIANGAAAISLV
jgi:hypothetical protein